MIATAVVWYKFSTAAVLFTHICLLAAFMACIACAHQQWAAALPPFAVAETCYNYLASGATTSHLQPIKCSGIVSSFQISNH